MKAKGKVIEEKGKYFVQIGTQKHELIPNVFAGVETFKPLVGQDVEAWVTDPQLVAIIKRPRCFLCYVPPYDLRNILEMDPAIRQGLLKGFVEAGTLDPGMAEKLNQASTFTH
jgi:hypothetical protein